METMTYVLLLAVMVVGEDVCPAHHSTPSGKPHFVKVSNSLDVRIHHAIYIRCCAENFDNITWFRQNLDNNKWEAYPWSAYPPGLIDGQVLDIRSATIPDNTTFRCDLVKDGVVKVQHITRLWVDSCDELARGPRLTSPFPVDLYMNTEGRNVSLYCTGYFGCSNFGPGIQGMAAWYIRDVNQQKYTPAGNVTSRYSVTQSSSSRNTVLGSVLHVQPVTDEDFQREFMCLLISPQWLDPSTNKTVRIHLVPKKNPIYWIIGGAGAVVALVLVIIGIICLTHRLCGPQIKWYCRSRMLCLGPKPYKEDTYSHNVFLYHAEESTSDMRMAESVRAELKKEHFNVCMSSDIMGNERLIEANQREAKQSALVVFLYTEDLRRSDFAMFFLENLVEYRKGKGILFLIVDKYEPEVIQKRTLDGAGDKICAETGDNSCNHGDKMQAQVNDQGETRVDDKHRAETGDNGNHGDEIRANVNGQGETRVDDKRRAETGDNGNHGDEIRAKVNGQGQCVEDSKGTKEKIVNIDLNFWKVLPRIQVPKEGASVRQNKRFHCALKNKIPLSERQLKQIRRKYSATDSVSSSKMSSKGRHSSSGKPLLSSTSEAPQSPCGIEQINPAAISPNSDSVFAYDTMNPIDLSLDKAIDRNLKYTDDSKGVPEYTQYDNSGQSTPNIPATNHVIVDVDVHTDNNIENNPESPSSLTVESGDIAERGVFLMSGEETPANQDLSPLNSPPFPNEQFAALTEPTERNAIVRGEREHSNDNRAESSSSSVGHGSGIKSESSGYNSLGMGDYHVAANNATNKPVLMPLTSDSCVSSSSEQPSSPESGYDTSSSDKQLSSDLNVMEPVLKKGLHQIILEIEEVA